MHRFLRTVPAIFALSTLALGACVESPPYEGKPPAATIAIDGAHGVLVGFTVRLDAQTLGGEDTGYTWASLDEGVATVDDSGVVTGVAQGETFVTATGKESGAVGRHSIVVAPVDGALPPEIVISGEHGLVVGSTITLTAATENGSDAGYTWASLNESVVTVDAAGVVTGVGVGETSITATGNDTGEVGRHAIVVMPKGGGGPEVPYLEAWSNSGHADKTAEAFKHWNEDDPAEVPVDCARCHSNQGFLDFIGEDGSAAGVVDQPAPVGSTVECQTCHNDTTANLDFVTFPSGVTVTDLGAEARCMTCHQGRASGDTVEASITAAAVPDADTASDELGFLNIHYYAAGATIYAGKVRGGYQYEGQVYDWRFRHVEGYDTCVGCHDQHTLAVKVDECATCHTDVARTSDARNIRMIASLNQDYDGDGDLSEGMYFELDGLRSRLMAAMQAYTKAKGFGAVCYSGATYPYWFKDTNDDGACQPDEAAFPNRYVTWSARLVRAAYNYQVSLKDPGAYAHNAKYIIQLIHDATADIAGALAQPELLGEAVRNDFGHFNGASEAARHWDTSEAVEASCSKCHGGSEGFRFFLKYGVGTPVVEPDNGLDCATCHETFGDEYALVNVPQVTFPSGVTIASDDSTTNMCSTCHSGRESKATIDAAIAANKLGFRNVHYLPAASVRQGSAARVGYEYEGKTYKGAWTGHPGGDSCNSCHSGANTRHSFQVADNFTACTTCHQAAAEASDIRGFGRQDEDYDGDGSVSEPLAGELEGLAAGVLASMQAVVQAAGGTGICYDSHTYPYFFIDTDGSGACDGGAEANYGNSFKAWTPGLMKAAHNFQMSQKDPGAWAHNFDYIGQLLFDSIADLGGDTSGFMRP